MASRRRRQAPCSLGILLLAFVGKCVISLREPRGIGPLGQRDWLWTWPYCSRIQICFLSGCSVCVYCCSRVGVLHVDVTYWSMNWFCEWRVPRACSHVIAITVSCSFQTVKNFMMWSTLIMRHFYHVCCMLDVEYYNEILILLLLEQCVSNMKYWVMCNL